MNIPVAHVQGGETTGSIDEKVRHAITKLSDAHFVSTKRSKKFVINMGEMKSCVYHTGCPSIDLALLKDYSLEKNFFNKNGTGANFSSSEKYILVLQHPVTTEYKNANFQIDQTILLLILLKLFKPSKTLLVCRYSQHLQQILFITK